MRIDQFLWCIRLFKSRNISSTACRKGQVKINDATVKPSREVLPLDKITVRKDQIWRKFDVLDLPKSRVGAKLVNIYAVETTSKEAFSNKEFQILSKVVERDKGTGRPTKKDRRAIDTIQDSSNEEE